MLKTACECLNDYISNRPVAFGIPKYNTGSAKGLAFYLALNEEVFRTIVKTLFGKTQTIRSKQFMKITGMHLAQYRTPTQHKQHNVHYLLNIPTNDDVSIALAKNTTEAPTCLYLLGSDANFAQRSDRLMRKIRKAFTEWLVREIRRETKSKVKLNLNEDEISTLLEVKSHDCTQNVVTRVIDLVEEESKVKRTYEWSFMRVGTTLIPASHKLVHKKTFDSMKDASIVMNKLEKTLQRKQYRGNGLSDRFFAGSRIGKARVRICPNHCHHI